MCIVHNFLYLFLLKLMCHSEFFLCFFFLNTGFRFISDEQTISPSFAILFVQCAHEDIALKIDFRSGVSRAHHIRRRCKFRYKRVYFGSTLISSASAFTAGIPR
jgi:hypothetical protein